MNFFGHAVIAGWRDPGARHLLGSMLPDFETMVRVPLLEVRDPDIQRGINLHHRTDDAFHRAPVFVAFCSRARMELTAAGVRRGTARAVGHIGSEMFLDGWLTRDPAHIERYLGALDLDANDLLEWKDDGQAFSKLRDRLTSWGAPHEYSEPSFVLARLADALRVHPALCVLEEQEATVAEFLPSLQQMVEREAPELLNHLQDALGSED